MKLTYCAAQAEYNNVGVLVVPGGGYGYVSLEKEGVKPAQWLNERGFDAWILEYTTADKSPAPLYPVPLDEALEAVRQIRGAAGHDAHSRRPSKLGIWGFSAGGHVAAMTVTEVEVLLDFAILAYPVISMEPDTTHLGSLHNLLGEEAEPELRRSMSAETRVGKHTPPVFLFHTGNDAAVPVQNSLLFASALAAHECSLSMLILPDGGHGAGLALDDPILSWTGELERWLRTFVATSVE